METKWRCIAVACIWLGTGIACYQAPPVFFFGGCFALFATFAICSA